MEQETLFPHFKMSNCINPTTGQVTEFHQDSTRVEISINSGIADLNTSMSEVAWCASGEMKYLSSYPDVEEAVGGGLSSGFDHWVKVGRSAGLEYVCSPKSPYQLWINVMEYKEGISAWRTSLSELLYLAKELSAILVEPCMKDGKIGSCGKRFVIPVSQVLDLSWAFLSIDGRPPLMVSYKDYQKQRQQFQGKRTNHNICLPLETHQSLSLSTIQECNLFDGAALIEDILDIHQLTSLNINEYWWRKTSMASLRDTLKIGPLPDSAKLHALSFHPQHTHTVQQALQSAELHGDFSVIHWRAEKEGMDLMECAEAVVDTRRTMEEMNNLGHEGSDPFLLMTSLNEDSDMMWWGSRKVSGKLANTPKEAIDMLVKENGFIKFDALLKAAEIEVKDPGMLAVYDLILASMSMNFATCLKGGSFGCSKQAIEICNKCNHVGKFGQLAVQLREEASKERNTLFECWPQSQDI